MIEPDKPCPPPPEEMTRTENHHWCSASYCGTQSSMLLGLSLWLARRSWCQLCLLMTNVCNSEMRLPMRDTGLSMTTLLCAQPSPL